VQQRKLKGVVHLLEMSNAELRRDFGLLCPVERIVVRQSLKRLLYADRWENNARGQKVCDIMGDSVLSHYIIPLEELTLVQKIAQGGYGTVYRGVLESSARSPGTPNQQKSNLVAVKEMKGERRVRLYELLKEARVMASLSNENICTFIGICADASARKHYILSELMDCSLFDLIHQPYKLRWHGELSVSLVVALSKGVSAGIAYIHAKNLVHADLKSSNILIDYSSSWQLIPRICDFGHAAVRAFPSPHHRCGTPHWAGPEVLRGEALGPAADIYSFGVIMWEMLTQKLPHKGLSFGQVLAAVGWAGFCVDLSALPRVPAELRQLLRNCLSFTPSGRPDSCEVQLRLRHIPEQECLLACPV
jgi:serine/threonine protein kinase